MKKPLRFSRRSFVLSDLAVHDLFDLCAVEADGCVVAAVISNEEIIGTVKEAGIAEAVVQVIFQIVKTFFEGCHAAVTGAKLVGAEIDAVLFADRAGERGALGAFPEFLAGVAGIIGDGVEDRCGKGSSLSEN